MVAPKPDRDKSMSKRHAVWGSDKTYGSKISASLAAGVMAAKNRYKQGRSGNQNAAKERSKGAQVAFRCFDEDRASWEVCAKSDGLSLGAWICRELNRSSNGAGSNLFSVHEQETP